MKRIRIRAQYRSGREQGFTLIELLVSLAILSLVATMLLGGVAMARQMSNRMNQTHAANEEIVTAQTILRDRIEHLSAVRRLNAGEAVVDVQGTEHVFTFFAPQMYRRSPDSIQGYRLLLMTTGDLVLFTVSGLADAVDIHDPSLAGWTPTRLLTGVAGLSMAYLGPDQSGTGRGWQRFWDDRRQPPELVRIRVTLADGDTRAWPDLVIRPQVTVNTACPLDRFTGRCRELTRQ